MSVVPVAPSGLPLLYRSSTYDADGQPNVVYDFGTYRRMLRPVTLEVEVDDAGDTVATVRGEPLKLDGTPAKSGPTSFTYLDPATAPGWVARCM